MTKESWIWKPTQEEMDIFQKTANAFGYSVNEIKSKSRTQDISDVRHIIAYKLREKGTTLMKIGEIMKRDHTTVVNSLKKYEQLKQIDKSFQRKIESLK